MHKQRGRLKTANRFSDGLSPYSKPRAWQSRTPYLSGRGRLKNTANPASLRRVCRQSDARVPNL
ncbi:hypothetical protein [Kingella potus]|uniref:hypothetical protein n=1 Tax=Kingella potus TaxID=265175 RepID=UPI0011C07E58|nr:hypothetical protein [Kingella potus]UOP00208.1 hypothetical protein LVJ84_09755 [Kingella potus]